MPSDNLDEKVKPNCKPIALLLRQQVDAQALASVLTPHYSTKRCTDVEGTDLSVTAALLIVDGMMLWHHHAWISRQRQGKSASRLFVLLLLASGRARAWPEARYRNCYDDVLLAPLDREETLLRVGQLLAHRATALANAKLLVQTQVDAEDLRRERARREHLILTLGHDLRSPLTAARIGVERLKGELETLIRLKRVGRVLLALDRINLMIEELLEAARVEKLHSTSAKQECNLRELVDRTLLDLTVLYGNRFVVDLAPDVGGLVQEDKIIRVLENLCSNAVKYGDATAPVVVQGFVREGQVSLQVANHGEPLSEKTVRTLFDAFTRADLPEGRKAVSGFGIGLAMVKEAAQSHQGQILAFRDEHARNVFGIQFPDGKTKNFE